MPFATLKFLVVNRLRRVSRRVAATSLILAMLLISAWLVSQRGGTPLDDHPVATQTRLIVPAPFALRAPLSLSSPDGVDVCGYGYIPVLGGNPQVPPALAEAAETALGQIARDLAARSTDGNRALGLFLLAGVEANTAGASWIRDHGECVADDAACLSAKQQAVSIAAQTSQRALLKLATGTSDADAYVLAIRSCGSAIGDGASGDCALLSYAQWARIEPDNAVPWMYLANDALRHADSKALESALYRASKARYSDPHWDQFSALLASGEVGAQTPTNQIGLALSLSGMRAAMTIPSMEAPFRYCSVAALSDPNRVQICGDLAAMWIQNGRTDIDVYMGARIAERVGWTDPRLAALRDEFDAMLQSLKMMPALAEEAILSCDALKMLRSTARAQAEFGDAARLRQGLVANGLTVAQAAWRWRTAIRDAAQAQGHEAKASR